MEKVSVRNTEMIGITLARKKKESCPNSRKRPCYNNRKRSGEYFSLEKNFNELRSKTSNITIFLNQQLNTTFLSKELLSRDGVQ